MRLNEKGKSTIQMFERSKRKRKINGRKNENEKKSEIRKKLKEKRSNKIEKEN